MPIRRFLRSLGVREDQPAPPKNPFLSRLNQHLKRLGPDRLEYLAAVAGQLVRVAHADAHVSDAEAASIGRVLKEHADLTAAEARLVVDLIRNDFEVFASTQHYVLNRVINRHATKKQKEHLIDCLYAVAAADHVVLDTEEQQIRQVAGALLLPHKTLMDIRSRYRDHLEVLQMVKRSRGS